MTRKPAIDGLRAIAALLVIVAHSFPVWITDHVTWRLNPGTVAVRLFFVLSGCLITHLLWSMHEDGGPWGQTWRRFAARRALRILPLAYLAMIVCWLAGVPAMLEQPWYHLTFTNNIARGYVTPWPDGMNHFWTLAVEEQVYLVWPLLVLVMPFGRWWLMAAFVAVATFAVRLVWPWEQSTAAMFYLWSFAGGSFVAWTARRGTAAHVAPLFSMIGLSLWGAFFWSQEPVAYATAELGLVLVTTAVVAWVWQRPAHRALSYAPLVWLGTLSYGIYVWHEAAPRILYQLGLPFIAEGWDVLALKGGLGIGCAALTWYGFERPINRLKDRIGHGHQTPVADPLAV